MFHMMLNDYLTTNKLTLAQFAARTGVSASTVFRIRDGVVLPSLRTIQAIEAATGGLVTRIDLIASVQPREAKENT